MKPFFLMLAVLSSVFVFCITGVSFCSDGPVSYENSLVLEAGKTRRQVAIRARKELEEAGGKLLGVVLNKRRYYIPDWIYRRL